MNISRFFTVFLFVIILFALTFIIIPNTDASQLSGSITLHQPEQVAKVGPGEDGIVNFTGEVRVNLTGIGANVQTVVVWLTADAPWPTTISPSTMTWTPREIDDAKEFNLTVKVPNFTSASQVEEIFINGTITTYPGALSTNLPPEKGTIRIAEYAQLMLSCWEPYIEAVSGDTVLFQLNAKNEGNGEASINVEFKGIDELIDQGWEFENVKNSFNLNEKNEEVLNFTISIPSNAPIGLHSFDVDAYLSSGDETDEKIYRLFLNVTEEDNGANDNGKMESEGEKGDDEIIPGFELSFLIIALFISFHFLHKFMRKFQ
ncbi:MAG: choice-of-anchor T family protein [Candidatus Thermoplasmatota archaeon]|jgi:hypothetical protein|nr:choice-of-anchor T family protein [Candidatus Thermoplasmatota archaeon]